MDNRVCRDPASKQRAAAVESTDGARKENCRAPVVLFQLLLLFRLLMSSAANVDIRKAKRRDARRKNGPFYTKVQVQDAGRRARLGRGADGEKIGTI